MELLLETRTVNYLQEVFFDTISQEETGETIVPDSYPDVERIVEAFGTVVLRGKDYRTGSMSISGGVHAGVIYEPEDHSEPKVLHYYIPFTVKLENDRLTENSRAVTDLRVRSVDARIVNSRKVMVRVNLCGSVSCYEPAEQEICGLPADPGDLQMKTASYQVQRALETTEKPFTVSEEAELPGGRAPMRELCRCQVEPEIVDTKIVGTKGVFKGNLNVRILYLTEEDELTAWNCQLPFSQYADFQQEHEDQELSCRIALTDLSVEDANGQGKRLLLNLQLLAQCTVVGQENLEVIDDAFSLRYDFTPQWKKLDAAGRLDRQVSSEVVRGMMEAPAAKTVVDTWVFLDEPASHREGEQVVFTVPMIASVLYRDESNELQGASVRMEAGCRTDLAPNCTCRAAARVVGEPFAVPAGDGLEVRCTVETVMDSQSADGIRTLCGGQLGSEPLPLTDCPSVILRPTAPEDTLWSLAKRCRTTQEAIRAANDLSEENPQLQGMLLIPIVKS